VTQQRGRYRDALRHRDFRLLVAAFIVDQVGSWAYNVVLIVWVYDRTHSTTWVAATTASGWVPRLVFSTYAGVLADRYERTTVMLYSALLSFVAMAGVAITVTAAGPVVLALSLAAVAASTATAYRPAAGAVLPDVVGETDLISANAIFSGLEGLVIVLGPAIGGLLLLAGSPAAGITFNALTFLASALVIERMSVRSRGTAGVGGESLAAQVGAGLTALRQAPIAATLVAFCCLDSGVYAASTIVYEPLSHRLGTGSNGYSYLIAAVAIGGVLVSALANRFSASSRLAPVILAGMFMMALPFAASVPVRSPAIEFGLQVITGAGMVIVDVLAVTALQRDLPRNLLSRVLGIFESAIPAAQLLASGLTAAILRTTTLDDTLLAIGFGFSAAAMLGLPLIVRADRRVLAAVRGLRPIVATLESLDLFTGASQSAFERLARAAQQISLPAGAVVVRQGDVAEALWVLLSGEVDVSARGEAGRSRRLRTMTSPSYFGEIGLLRNIRRTATVRTLEPCELLRIAADDFLDAAQTSGVSGSMLARSAARLAYSGTRTATASTVNH
jgi:MFS family permease